jgi:hypothetical protein
MVPRRQQRLSWSVETGSRSGTNLWANLPGDTLRNFARFSG